MNIATFVFFLGLFAAPAFAKAADAAERDSRNGMSYQDYVKQREKLLKHMNPHRGRQTPEAKHDLRQDPPHGTTYGQGYGSRRERAGERPRIEKPSRPERPPHFERPGRF